jgi:misacylated tRNA(Ala) deacylase
MDTQLLFMEDAYLKDFTAQVMAVKDNAVVLDRTAFYYTSGGQPGDKGVLSAGGNSLNVETAVRDRESGMIWHVLAPGQALPATGDEVSGAVDWDTRHRHMRMHTALHLLCALVKGDVTGGQVGADKGRLDFNLEIVPDKDELTERLNALVSAAHPVGTRWITDAELEASPQLVRTMSVRPPRGAGRVRLLRIGADENVIDLQPCGGTHVRDTSEIGPLRLERIENKGKQNRRFSLVFADDAP